jgi:uncharacterized protein (TIRG00374 family)
LTGSGASAASPRPALLGLLLGAGLLGAILASVQGPALAQALARADAGWLAVVALVTLGSYGTRAWRLGALLRPLVDVPFRRLVTATYIGYMAGLVVPRSNEVIRPWLVARRHGASLGSVFASIVLERIVDVAIILGLFGAGLVLDGGRLDGDWSRRVWAASLVAAVVAAGVLVLLVALQARPEATTRGLTALVRPFAPRVAGLLAHAVASFTSGLGVLRAAPAHLASIALQSVLVWGFVALGVYASNRAFGIDLPWVSALVVLGFVVVGVTLPTPAGMGGFHAAYVVALTALYSVDRERAVAAALACHGVTSAAVLLVGLACLPAEGLTFREAIRGAPRPS